MRVCTDQTKARCTNLSSQCRLSIENSRLAVKIIGENLYNHKIYLPIERCQ